MIGNYEFASLVDDIFSECNTIADVNSRFIEMQNTLKSLFEQNIALKAIEDNKKNGGEHGD